MGDSDERPTTSSIEIQVYRPTTVGGSYTQLPRDLGDGEYERCPEGATTLKYRPDDTPGLGLLDPDSGMMELFAKTLSGKTISVHVDEDGDESVESLKGKIELQTGIPAPEQHLMFAGMPLEAKEGEPRTLGDYNIRKGPVPLTVYMIAKIEVTASVHEIDMDDEEVVFGNLQKDLEGINVNLEWLLNSDINTEVVRFEEGGPDNVLVAKMKEMTATLRELQEEREKNQARHLQLKKDIAKIGADKEDIIWHATRLCVEGPREDGLELRDRQVKVTEGPDGKLEAEWAKQWNIAGAARSTSAHQKGGWSSLVEKISRPKNDGKTIPGAKAAVIDLNLAAAKKNGVNARERKVLHAQQIDEPMSKVWERAIELGVLKDSDALAQQDAERRRAHAVLNRTNKEKNKIMSGLEADIARARAIGKDRIESMEEQFRMLSGQRDRMCAMLGGAQDTLPLAITKAHKKRMKTSMDNRAELMTMTREFDIEKNERNKKAAAAIAKKQEELNADADQRARDKRTEAYATAEKLSTDVTASSELVSQKMRNHGQGVERVTEAKRQSEIRQETEHALATRSTKLLKRIKDLVIQIGELSEENEALKAQAKALGAAAEENAGPPPETEATTRIAMFEMQELAREVKTVKKLRREIAMEKQRVQKKCARLRNELEKQAQYILMLQERQEKQGQGRSGNTSLPMSIRGAANTPSTAPASGSRREGADAEMFKPSPPSFQQAQASRASARITSGFRLPQLRGQ